MAVTKKQTPDLGGVLQISDHRLQRSMTAGKASTGAALSAPDAKWDRLIRGGTGGRAGNEEAIEEDRPAVPASGEDGFAEIVGKLSPPESGGGGRSVAWPGMTRLYANPSCSKSRGAEALLAERGIEAEIILYLETPPTVEELRDLMAKLDIEDPREMLRRGEAAYGQLDLDEASTAEVLGAVTRHPVLLERPIFVVGDRAVIARPPERLLELL